METAWCSFRLSWASIRQKLLEEGEQVLLRLLSPTKRDMKVSSKLFAQKPILEIVAPYEERLQREAKRALAEKNAEIGSLRS